MKKANVFRAIVQNDASTQFDEAKEDKHDRKKSGIYWQTS